MSCRPAGVVTKSMQDGDEIPLFPLGTVLFPGGLLPLRIFEARYLDMISECMREQKGFGVCAIRSGSEVGRVANCHDIGTLATVQDFDRGEDGLLSVVVRGERRFRLIQRRVENNQLLRATVEWLDDSDDAALPEEHKTMATFLEQLLKRAGEPFSKMETNFESCDWVAGRLAELLPFALADKQRLLEMDIALDRLDVLYGELLAEELSHRR